MSSSQMQAWSAICEAFIPSVPMESVHISSGKEEPSSKTLQAFYLASGSQHPIPDQAAEMLVRRMLPEAVMLVRVVLWLLATRMGTLVLCGSLSFCRRFPFISKFQEMALERREEVLQRWTQERFFVPLKIVFLLCKMPCLYTFYSMVTILATQHN